MDTGYSFIQQVSAREGEGWENIRMHINHNIGWRIILCGMSVSIMCGGRRRGRAFARAGVFTTLPVS